MGKMKIILVATLIILVTLSIISYANGWRSTLQVPESSTPALQEPASSYG
ncbi:hypothetical protein ACFLXU_04780 [Chloroflexota bacterium]